MGGRWGIGFHVDDGLGAPRARLIKTIKTTRNIDLIDLEDWMIVDLIDLEEKSNTGSSTPWAQGPANCVVHPAPQVRRTTIV